MTARPSSSFRLTCAPARCPSKRCNERGSERRRPIRSSPFGVSRKPPVVRAPSPGHEHPLMRSACPSERSSSRVASFWLPAPPMSFTRERAGLRGLSRYDFPETPKSQGPSRGLRPLYRVSNRSLRPTRLRVDSSHGVLRPYDDIREQVRFTRDCLSRHLPTSGFGYPLVGLLPARGSDPRIGHRPWGSPFRAFLLDDQPHPFPGRGPLVVSGSPVLLL